MATWKELDRYCNNDEWECYKITDHKYYRKLNADGTMRYTKVSLGTGEIPKRLFKEILSKQLHISKAEFNSKI